MRRFPAGARVLSTLPRPPAASRFPARGQLRLGLAFGSAEQIGLRPFERVDAEERQSLRQAPEDGDLLPVPVVELAIDLILASQTEGERPGSDDGELPRPASSWVADLPASCCIRGPGGVGIANRVTSLTSTSSSYPATSGRLQTVCGSPKMSASPKIPRPRATTSRRAWSMVQSMGMGASFRRRRSRGRGRWSPFPRFYAVAEASTTVSPRTPSIGARQDRPKAGHETTKSTKDTKGNPSSGNERHTWHFFRGFRVFRGSSPERRMPRGDGRCSRRVCGSAPPPIDRISESKEGAEP